MDSKVFSIQMVSASRLQQELSAVHRSPCSNPATSWLTAGTISLLPSPIEMELRTHTSFVQACAVDIVPAHTYTHLQPGCHSDRVSSVIVV